MDVEVKRGENGLARGSVKENHLVPEESQVTCSRATWNVGLQLGK